MSDTFVVIWRPNVRTRWAVQPHVHSGELAARVGGALVNQFGGEAWSLPIVIPAAEDPRDLDVRS